MTVPRLVFGITFLIAGGAGAQGWEFQEPGGTEGAARWSSDRASMSFVCHARGSEAHDPDNLTWRVGGADLGLSAASGDVVRLGLALDGEAKGEGPFLMSEAGDLATSLPRALPFLESMRAASEMRLSTESASVTIPLGGLGEALTALTTWCDQEPARPDQPELSASICDAPEGATQEAICASPRLRGLEAELAAALNAQFDTLNEGEKRRLEQAQASWIAFRENCADSADCIASATQARIEKLAIVEVAAPTEVVVQSQPAPPEALSVPLTPLQPAELNQVIWDPGQVQLRLLIEMVRSRPELMQDRNVLSFWARNALKGQAFGQSGQDAVTRDHLSRSVAATPPGPFLVGRFVNNPLAGAAYSDGQFRNSSNSTREIGRTTHNIGGRNFEQRAISQYDVSKLAVNPEQAAYFQQNMNQLQLGVVTQIDSIDLPTANQAIARGQVRFAGLFDRPRQSNNQAELGQLVAVFSPEPPLPPTGGLDSLANFLSIPTHEGAVLADQYAAGGGVERLVRLAALKKSAPTELDETLRTDVFFQLATQLERDAVIPPHYFGHGNAQQFAFSPPVDEFERAELLNRVDKVLWPVVRARLPEFPIDVIARVPIQLSNYDQALGGFAFEAGGPENLGVANQGQYPAFQALPDFLATSVDQARQLISFLESQQGPGGRAMTLVVRYRVTGVGSQELANVFSANFPDQRQYDQTNVPLVPQVEPQSISLHAYDTGHHGQPDQTDPMDHLVKEFDLAAYRGPTRPAADPEAVAFWTEVAKTPLSTTDELVAATLRLSGDPDYLEYLVQNSTLVRSADQFSRLQAADEMRAALRALPSPETLFLRGTLQLEDYDQQSGRFPVRDAAFQTVPPSDTVPGPSLQLADPDRIFEVKADVETAKLLVGSDSGNTIPFFAWTKPTFTETGNRNSTLFLSVERLVAFSPTLNGAGYPVVYFDLELDDADAAPVTGQGASVGKNSATDVPAAPASTTPPGQIALDSEYFDLLMVREAGGALNDATWMRMMSDRLIREQIAETTGYPLAWGRFFSGRVLTDPRQLRGQLEAFRAWSIERAAVLPTEAYVQHTGIHRDIQCWHQVSAAYNPGARQNLPPALALRLESWSTDLQPRHLQFYERQTGAGPRILPALPYAVFGSPILFLSGVGSSAYCDGELRDIDVLSARQVLEAQSETALITVQGAVRAPVGNNRQDTVWRDIGTVKTSRGDDGVLEVVLEVTRTEVLARSDQRQSGGAGLELLQTLTADDLPEPPLAFDVFDITPGMAWDEAIEAAAARLPDAVSVEDDGPPARLRMVDAGQAEPVTLFEAYRNGQFFFSPDASEALAIMREPERDPDRVLAVGSHRIFAPGSVTPDALVGALLRKYGAAPATSESGNMYGSRPARALSWGAGAGCLPRMQNGFPMDQTTQQEIADNQLVINRFNQITMPQMPYNSDAQLVYETCEPSVWAMVDEDTERRVHLVVWSFDLALLHEVAKLEDTRPKIDGTEGSQTLIENAADVDL